MQGHNTQYKGGHRTIAGNGQPMVKQSFDDYSGGVGFAGKGKRTVYSDSQFNCLVGKINESSKQLIDKILNRISL